MELNALGWDDFFARSFAELVQEHARLVPARVVLEHKHAYELLAESGELYGEVLGRLLKSPTSSTLPAVGDWVAVELHGHGERQRASIHAVLPRRTRFSRRAPGERDEEQVIAANVDTVFLVNGLDADFNPRRIERYLTLARNSGAESVVLLNKADLCSDVAAREVQVRAISGDAPVHAISAERGEGLPALAPYLRVGRTVALLGSSGAGKLTLINCLFGVERQAVGTVRDDDRGRHTTTRRELVMMPAGALLIDTPGMRELQLWDSPRDTLAAVFPEIVEHASGCRFRDCRHEAEPECAVRVALQSGAVSPERFASFLKLRAELEQREAARQGGTNRSRGGGVPRIKGRRIMRG